MLNKSSKSEEERRIESIVAKLSGIGLVINDQQNMTQLNEVLSGIGLTYDNLVDMTPENLIAHLDRFHFNWEHMQQMADLLAGWALPDKARALYTHIQQNSKVFSFEIMTKLTQL